MSEINNLPYAEDVGNYWKTSQTSADMWMDKTQQLIKNIEGTILGVGYGSEPTTGRAAYMLQFQIGGNAYKIVWPVLPTTVSEKAARIQAATFIYHDVKAKVSSAKVLGARAAFFSYLMLPDGQTATQASIETLSEGIPTIKLLGE